MRTGGPEHQGNFFPPNCILIHTFRNRHNRPISFNREKGYYDASTDVVKTVIRDWWTADGMVSFKFKAYSNNSNLQS